MEEQILFFACHMPRLQCIHTRLRKKVANGIRNIAWVVLKRILLCFRTQRVHIVEDLFNKQSNVCIQLSLNIYQESRDEIRQSPPT